jgi:hypothetical protein
MFVPHPTLEDERRPLPSWGEAKKELGSFAEPVLSGVEGL